MNHVILFFFIFGKLFSLVLKMFFLEVFCIQVKCLRFIFVLHFYHFKEFSNDIKVCNFFCIFHIYTVYADSSFGYISICDLVRKRKYIVVASQSSVYYKTYKNSNIQKNLQSNLFVQHIYVHNLAHNKSDSQAHNQKRAEKKLCDCTINTKYKTTVIIQLNLLLLRSITQYHNERRFWNLRCLPASRTKAKAPHSTGTSIVTTSSRQVIFRVTNVLLSHQIA